MLKHTNDDGDLSIFASDHGLLYVCNRGHYWIVDTPVADGTQLSLSDGSTMRAIEIRFGAGAANFLRSLGS